MRGKWTKRLEKDHVEMVKSMPDLIGKLTLDGGAAYSDRPDPNSPSSRKTLRQQYKLSRKERTLLANVKVPKYKLGMKLVNGKLVVPHGLKEDETTIKGPKGT